MIADLVKLMRGSVCELSLYYINSTRQVVNWCKDPEGMLEGTGHVPLTHSSAERPGLAASRRNPTVEENIMSSQLDSYGEN